MMFSLLACVCFGSIFCGYVSGYADNNYALYFREKAVNDYASIWGMFSLTAFTVCFWMKSTDSPGSPFSYASTASSNELLFYYTSSGFNLWVGGAVKYLYVSAHDGNWHHICGSWENTNGNYYFYKDGVLEKQGSNFKKGHTIPGGGSLVLGQDQDSLGGSFFGPEAFKGTLTNVNIWAHVLSAADISTLSNSCLAGSGTVYNWPDFIVGVKGNTAVVVPSPCIP